MMTTGKRQVSLAREQARRNVFEHYGQLCACCGSGQYLSIDHVNGDGGDHRKTVRDLYTWLVTNNYPDGFQTLCRTCNSSKNTDQECKIHGNMFAYEIGHRAWWHMQVENTRSHVLGEILGYRLKKAQLIKTVIQHVSRTIGSHPRYNSTVAWLDIEQMTASDATAVLTMPETEMAKRWAHETDYETGYGQMRKQGCR